MESKQSVDTPPYWIYNANPHQSRAYSVQMADGCVGNSLLDALSNIIGNRDALIVTTPTAAKLYGARFLSALQNRGGQVEMIVLSCTEVTKNLPAVEAICTAYYERKMKRRSVLVAIGGGVCSDIVTVAASWIRRGVPHIRVPTTLIGQVDAGIGIKGAVNFHRKKSALGCFYPPECVLLDPEFLRTLPRRHIQGGLAEIVKIAMVSDADLFRVVEQLGVQLTSSRFLASDPVAKNVLWTSVVRMLTELEQNFFEDQTYQRLVDFGHTFSPFIEVDSRFVLTHGEAVSIDMALSTVLASALGLMAEPEGHRVLRLLQVLGLPIYSSLLTKEQCVLAMCEAANHRGGSMNLVLPISCGRATFIKDPEAVSDLLDNAILRLRSDDLAPSPQPSADYGGYEHERTSQFD